jgi:prophage antirepressor-like protein
VSTEIAKFDFEGKEVRTHVSEDGETWFCAKDVCDVLEHTNPTMACQDVDEDEKGLRIVETLKGKQNLLFVSESGFYVLVFKSRKLGAKAFSKWVRSVVLPTLRKTGSYSIEGRSGLVVPSDMAGLMEVVRAYVNERIVPLEADLESERKRTQQEAARAEAMMKERTQVISDMRAAQRLRDTAMRRLDAVSKHAYKAMKEAQEEFASEQSDMMAKNDASNILSLIPSRKPTP